MVLPSFFPAALILIAGPEEGEEPSGEEAVLRQIQIRLATLSLEEIRTVSQDAFGAPAGQLASRPYCIEDFCTPL